MSFDAASDSRLLRRLRDCLRDAARAVTFLEVSRLYGLAPAGHSGRKVSCPIHVSVDILRR